MSTAERSEILAAVDEAVARLLAQVDALRVARAILAGAPAREPAAPPARPASPGPGGRSPETGASRDPAPPATEPGEGAGEPVRRGRGLARSTLELHARLEKLMAEGVLSAAELAARVGRPVQSVYQALHDAGLSLRDARRRWEASRSVVEPGPVPVPPPAEAASPPTPPGHGDLSPAGGPGCFLGSPVGAGHLLNSLVRGGSSSDSSGEERAASVPELREEAVRRQRGCSGKAVQFATSLADGHSHVASVDRMGYGTTGARTT